MEDLFKSPAFGVVSQLKDRLNKFHYWTAVYYPKTGKSEWEVNSNAAQQKGCAVEMFIYDFITSYNPELEIEFDYWRCGEQWAFGRDGIPDNGYDLKVNGSTLDVKLDNMLKNGCVCLELETKTGNPSLLLSNTDYSCHVRYFEKSLPALFKLNKGAEIIFVDLNKVRGLLQKTSEGYKLGSQVSRRTRFGTLVIDIPVQWLKQKHMADRYKL